MSEDLKYAFEVAMFPFSKTASDTLSITVNNLTPVSVFNDIVENFNGATLQWPEFKFTGSMPKIEVSRLVINPKTRLEIIEREINKRITAIFQERPSLP